MKSQLSDGPVYGTLPVLYVFLARTGKIIHDVAYVGLDERGNIQALDEAADTGATNQKAIRSAVRGIRIVFSHDDGPRQTLYYFSTNLADSSVAHSGFWRSAKDLAQPTVSLRARHISFTAAVSVRRVLSYSIIAP